MNMCAFKKDRAEKIKQVLYEISQAVNETLNLNELFEKIHQSLSQIIDVSNFYIATYDPETEFVYFPYFVDEKATTIKEFGHKITKSSLTGRVIKEAKSLLMSKQEMIDYCKKNCDPCDTVSEIWLGVPMRNKDVVTGVIAVQSYKDPLLFDEEDIKVLNSVSDQVSVAIERKMYEDSLKKSENRYRALIENISEVIYSTDKDGHFLFVSSAIKKLAGYSPSEMVGKNGWRRFSLDEVKGNEHLFSQIIDPEHCQYVHDLIMDSVYQLQPFETEYKILGHNNHAIWVYEKGQFFKDDNGDVYLEGIISDIHGRKRADMINRTLYDISNAVNNTFNLDELYASIYHALGRIIDVENFFFAIYDKTKDIISFPFDTNKTDRYHFTEINHASKSPSFTAEVIRTGKRLMLNKKEQYQQVKKSRSTHVGYPSELWMGVPLIVRNEVIGAMVAQSYDNPNLYNEKDAEDFSSVSDQVAIAIDRKKAEEELIKKELIIRTLYEISNAINTTFNMEELYRTIHNSLKKMIDARNFAIGLYDEKLDKISYPYLVDEHNVYKPFVIENASQTSSLAFEVIKRGIPVILDLESIKALIKKKKGKFYGFLSKSWLGVPLKGKNRILGAIVIQNYNQEKHYKQRDIDLISSVSDQIAFAIERKKAETELASTQKELIENAHKAGMADIANSTLHDVGNILNSVKVSTDLINNVNKGSFISMFKKANGLLKQNPDSLYEFLVHDPTGKKLIDYYLKLEDMFDFEKQQIQEQVDRLHQKIELMTDVIITQQNFAGASFMTDEHSTEAIIDDVLTMLWNSLNRHHIKIEKIFGHVPMIWVQKTKIVHVLFNLINNAKDAILESSNKNRVLRISTALVDNSVRIEISDSGIGITQDNLNRIFNHGFSTKKYGNGFGLHNSANYMEDMKGRIWAESEGENKGATFFLLLPLVKKKAHIKVPQIPTHPSPKIGE